MAYTLDQLAADCRVALEADAGPAGLETVRQCVARACADSAFVTSHLGPDNSSPRKILYTDPVLGFCIIGHVYTEEAGSRPHDHGPSWAVYGQAAGTTEMTDWRVVSPPQDGGDGTVEAVRTYELRPGDAYAYAQGEVHSPNRIAEARLIRIEGINMDHAERNWYDPA